MEDQRKGHSWSLMIHDLIEFYSGKEVGGRMKIVMEN